MFLHNIATSPAPNVPFKQKFIPIMQMYFYNIIGALNTLHSFTGRNSCIVVLF